MLNDSVILTLFLGLGIFGTPTFLFVIWFLWRDLRDTEELADYYHEQWAELARRNQTATRDFLADWR